MDELEAIVANPGTTLLVARDDDQVVGMLTLATFGAPTGVRAWIEDVVVDDSARGAGVASALVKAALEEAGRRGSRTVDLTSRPAAGGGQPAVRAARLRAARDERLPLHPRK